MNFFKLATLSLFIISAFPLLASEVKISGQKALSLHKQMEIKQPKSYETSESGVVRTLGHVKEGVILTCIGNKLTKATKADCKIEVFDPNGKP